ncbi:hypothetical protein OH687_29800 [Burkholderia anthina]|nr:hypothetical protein OH687_29800 [Burkholderia anthina]
MQQARMLEGAGVGSACRRRPCIATVRSRSNSGRLAAAGCRCTLAVCNRATSVAAASGHKHCTEPHHEMASCNILDAAEWNDFLGQQRRCSLVSHVWILCFFAMVEATKCTNHSVFIGTGSILSSATGIQSSEKKQIHQ